MALKCTIFDVSMGQTDNPMLQVKSIGHWFNTVVSSNARKPRNILVSFSRWLFQPYPSCFKIKQHMKNTFNIWIIYKNLCMWPNVVSRVNLTVIYISPMMFSVMPSYAAGWETVS